MARPEQGRRDIGHQSLVNKAAPPVTHYASRITCHASPGCAGFTLLEMIFVMFLLSGVLLLVMPRIVTGDSLASTGRQLIGVLRNLQSFAIGLQKPVKLYVDLDKGTYWVMIIEGTEEKIPLRTEWADRRSLPESIRFADMAVGSARRMSGRIDLSIFPNGRIDPLTLHLTDQSNNLLGIAVESVTGAIRTSDERIEPPRTQTIPERLKTLLQPAQGPSPAALGLRFQ
jgi:prepilin-type N-terminal cleavage/methylation domain-containing protein